jgi:hypothetical protein
MILGIDSAENMCYTGTISGTHENVDRVYSEFTKIFKKRYVNPPFHWRKISKKVKESCLHEIVETINSANLLINIFEHKRILKMERKILFFELLPKYISFRIYPWVKKLKGSLTIEVDDDYRVCNRSTRDFIIALVEELCFLLTNKKIDARVENNVVKSTIKQEIGILNFYGKTVKSDSSKAIQILDIVLGYDIQFKQRFSKDRVHYWPIFKG